MKSELLASLLGPDLVRGHLWKPSKSPRACQCKEIFRTRKNINSLLSDEGLKVGWDILSGARECRLCAHLLDLHRRYPVYGQVEERFLNSDRPRLKALCFASDQDSGDDDDPGSDNDSEPDTEKATRIRYLYIKGLVDVAYSQSLVAVRSEVDDLIRCPSSLPLNYPMDGQIILEEAKRQLSLCERSHLDCSSALQDLPQRVVEVDHLPPRLRVTARGERDRYTALSYCWGSQPQATTTSNNFKSMQKGFAASSLARTLQDAITITRKLDIKYLWVDALCILQDSDSDKALYLDSMGSIYKHAVITITAESFDNALSGFLESKISHEGIRLPFLQTDDREGHVQVVPAAYKPPAIQPLDRRAWPYQERVLSTRTLSFGQGVISWKCQTKPSHPLVTGFPFAPPRRKIHYKYDGLDFSNKLPTRGGWCGSDYEKNHRQANLWKSILDNYTTREIKLHEDRLAALAGIAAQLNDYRARSYLAGFWEQSMEHLLFWVPMTSSKRLHDPLTQGPSWSWACCEGGIVFEFIRELYFNIISCTVELYDENSHFGRVKSGILTISAAVRTIRDLPRRHYHLTFDRQCDEESVSVLGGTEIFLLRLSHATVGWHSIGWIIIAVDGGHYKRLGTFRFSQNAPYDEHNWNAVEKSMVTII